MFKIWMSCNFVLYLCVFQIVLTPSLEILFQLLGMSYNHENWQVDAEKYFKICLGGGILIFWSFWILLIFFKNINKKNQIRSVKFQKIEKSKFHLLNVFWNIFLHLLAKFHDCSSFLAAGIKFLVIFFKSHFCKNTLFLA